MESLTPLTTSHGSLRNWNDDTIHVKILCSFNGSILPHPRDGKLRYVGGETRILSIPRDIRFHQLMVKMKELFEGVSILKYKQPYEDVDALVSVVNDDDVTIMMEEHDSLGSGDGFTRLRVFLFSNSEQDDPFHFLDSTGKDYGKRYVDALNTANGSPEFGRHHMSESLVDDVQSTEQYFNQLNFGNFETLVTPVNLHNLTIPRSSSLPHQMEPPRSPIYYSPRHPGNDFQSPPSCSYYHGPFDEPMDRIYEQVPSEDYYRWHQHHVSHLSHVDHQSQLLENVPRLQPSRVSTDKTNFPNNILHGTNMFKGNNVCDHCPPLFHHPLYIRDSDTNVATGSTSYLDIHQMPLPYVHQDDRSHYIYRGYEFGNELFHDQSIARYGEFATSNGRLPANSYLKDIQSPKNGSPSNEASISPQQENSTNNGFGNYLVEPTPKLASYNEVDIPDCYHVRPLKLIPNSYNLEDQPMPHEPALSTSNIEDHPMPHEPALSTSNMINCLTPNDLMTGFDQSPTLVDCKALSLNTLNKEAIQNENKAESLIKIERKDGSERQESNVSPHSLEKGELIVDRMNYIPPIVEIVKKATLESGEDVKDEAEESINSATKKDVEVKEENTHELDVDAPEDLELDSDTSTETNSKIEPTKAEEEAIARGLQTIKNDDLEEIRQLGCGTYGAVYHGKWKGSDVAIKRIKASCFSGKPTERERMIADFWKEALMLSSLHHPNVVSFYGIVRDGPGGSLATVTEYMINGSLKQFLKKKDRTIDRRKRFIIAMDTAFGMEYLHGKNIVHFDLKCENLLVNMRDPHRPICKIGDLGLSKVKQQTMVSGSVRGTLPWMAPELLSGKSNMVTEKIDVYSFGVVMWELLTGDEPYTNMHCASLIGGILNNTLRPTIPTWCDPEWKSLMESCWSVDPQERPSFLEISQKLRTMAASINVK